MLSLSASIWEYVWNPSFSGAWIADLIRQVKELEERMEKQKKDIEVLSESWRKKSMEMQVLLFISVDLYSCLSHVGVWLSQSGVW